VRIVIDLQGAQASNKCRGIGRYSISLALAIAKHALSHEIVIALNGSFPDTIKPIAQAFSRYISNDNIRIWYPLPSVLSADKNTFLQIKASETIRKYFIDSLRPDVLLLTSLFEGFGDSAITSIDDNLPYATAVILYDLIPHVHKEVYLANPALEHWYSQKLAHLTKADILLAISNSSKQEAVAHLAFEEEKVFCISADADSMFKVLKIDDNIRKEALTRTGLKGDYIMYTGGIDHRKNIESLIKAYAKLPVALIDQYQLAIVCHASDEAKSYLSTCASSLLNRDDRVVLTGYVSDDDLVRLYNMCSLFVFPSWHEGFGLPVLEAMRCGAPAIVSNVTSLPEVIGLNEALFDPYSIESISSLMKRALLDNCFLERLRQNSVLQAQKFSWDRSAKETLSILETYSGNTNQTELRDVFKCKRHKLAFVSPMPPQKTGIAAYSSCLIAELARYYDIDIIVADGVPVNHQNTTAFAVQSASWFVLNWRLYDRIVYQFGNSDFHGYMINLLTVAPGVVVVHDFYLSGLFFGYSLSKSDISIFALEIYRSHGYAGLAVMYKSGDVGSAIKEYPCNLQVIQNSLGVILHSKYAYDLIDKWYSINSLKRTIVPLLPNHTRLPSRETARLSLGFKRHEFIVCSFGFIAPTKHSDRLLEAWIESEMSGLDSCHLVFVGSNLWGDYAKALDLRVNNHNKPGHVKITGWADDDDFVNYLAAADMAVQLRTDSRGETSGCVVDCMLAGLPLIVNANGSMAELDKSSVWMLDDNFENSDLVDAMNELYKSEATRANLSEKAGIVAQSHNSPASCANLYKEFVETVYAEIPDQKFSLYHDLADLLSKSYPAGYLSALDVANAVSLTFKPSIYCRQVFVDVAWIENLAPASECRIKATSLVASLMLNPPSGCRIEPVLRRNDHDLLLAHQFAFDCLDIISFSMPSAMADISIGDLMLCISADAGSGKPVFDNCHLTIMIRTDAFEWTPSRSINVGTLCEANGWGDGFFPETLVAGNPRDRFAASKCIDKIRSWIEDALRG